MRRQEGVNKDKVPTTWGADWGADWYYFSAANYSIISWTHLYAASLRYQL